jgi:hypothetical protein
MLQSKQYEATGSVIYYDERMLENNICIDVDKRGGVMISHFNDLIATDWHLSVDDALGIQVDGMLKNIHELFQENTVEDFLRIVNQMSIFCFDSTDFDASDFDEIYKHEFELSFRNRIAFIAGIK